MAIHSKITFAGLDKTGKTSIILALKNKFSLVPTRPTLGIDQVILNQMKWLGLNITVFDFGGQQLLRKDYFTSNSQFQKTSTLFYVFDIQDTGRVDEALDYFKKIIEKFRESKERPQISILLHKVDPEIRDSPKTRQQIELLTDKVKKINGDFPILFQETSIYDQACLADAFFNGVIKNTNKGQLIGNYLREYAKLTFSSAVVLLDDNVLIVGSHSTDPRFIEICETISPSLIIAIERIKRYAIKMDFVCGDILFEKNAPSTTENTENSAKIFLQRFESAQKMPFTLMTLTLNKNTSKLSETHLPNLAKQMSELINSIM